MSFTPVVAKRVALVIAVLGSFLPWLDLGSFNAGGKSFVEGAIVMWAALIGLLISFTRPIDPRARTFEVVLAALTLGAPGWFYVDTFTRGGDGFGGSPGYGLFLCAAAGAFWLAWLAWDYRRVGGHVRRQRPPRRLDDWG